MGLIGQLSGVVSRSGPVVRSWRSTQVRDLTWTAGANALALVTAFASAILAARLLGPTGRGEYATAIAWQALLLALGDFGLPQALTFYCGRFKESIGLWCGTALLSSVTIGVALIVIAQTIVAPLLDWFGVVSTGIRVYSLSIPFSVWTTNVTTIFQGLNDLKTFNAIRLANNIFYVLAFSIAFAIGLRTATGVLVLVACGSILSGLLALALLARRVPVSQWQIRGSALHQVFSYGSRAYLGNLSWLLNGRLDQIALSLFVPAAQLGFYAVSVSYAAILFSISSAFAMVAFPRIAAEQKASQGVAMTMRFLKLALFSSALLALFLGISASWLITLCYGERFQPSIFPARALLGSGILLGANYVLSSGLRGMADPLGPAKAEVMGLLITIVGLATMVPRFGITGAAFVPLASYTVIFLVLLQLVSKAGRYGLTK